MQVIVVCLVETARMVTHTDEKEPLPSSEATTATEGEQSHSKGPTNSAGDAVGRPEDGVAQTQLAGRVEAGQVQSESGDVPALEEADEEACSAQPGRTTQPDLAPDDKAPEEHGDGQQALWPDGPRRHAEGQLSDDEADSKQGLGEVDLGVVQAQVGGQAVSQRVGHIGPVKLQEAEAQHHGRQDDEVGVPPGPARLVVVVDQRLVIPGDVLGRRLSLCRGIASQARVSAPLARQLPLICHEAVVKLVSHGSLLSHHAAAASVSSAARSCVPASGVQAASLLYPMDGPGRDPGTRLAEGFIHAYARYGPSSVITAWDIISLSLLPQKFLPSRSVRAGHRNAEGSVGCQCRGCGCQLGLHVHAAPPAAEHPLGGRDMVNLMQLGVLVVSEGLFLTRGFNNQQFLELQKSRQDQLSRRFKQDRLSA